MTEEEKKLEHLEKAKEFIRLSKEITREQKIDFISAISWAMFRAGTRI